MTTQNTHPSHNCVNSLSSSPDAEPARIAWLHLLLLHHSIHLTVTLYCQQRVVQVHPLLRDCVWRESSQLLCWAVSATSQTLACGGYMRCCWATNRAPTEQLTCLWGNNPPAMKMGPLIAFDADFIAVPRAWVRAAVAYTLELLTFLLRTDTCRLRVGAP
jgi:hypothetical protein